ncbi:DJ-1/PfpI family protein [bacterium]|nr:DJ-1/PfpI family protein [bacterium]
MKKILAFYAEGSEDAEFVITVDLLRRAKIFVKTVSVSDRDKVTLSHNILTSPDTHISNLSSEEIDSYDGLFLPGGKAGVENLSKCEVLLKIIKDFHDSSKLVSAVCAAPSVLSKAGIMKNHKFTCYEGWQSQVEGEYERCGTVISSNVITGRSLNYSIDLSLEIIEYLLGAEKRKEVEKSILKVEEL